MPVTLRAAVAAALALPAVLSIAACAPRYEPAGPAVTAPRIETASPMKIVAADGAMLPLRCWTPEGAPRAVFLALHGFNDYSRAFEVPGGHWAKRGIETCAYDQRGFGAGPHPRIWSDTKTLADDARTAAALLRARRPGVPLFVVGESMGGAVAMVAATEHGLRADGLVLVAPALRGRRYLGLVPRASLWLFSRLVPALILTGEGLRIQASDNIPMLRALGADPLVIKGARLDTIRGLVDLMDRAVDAAPRLGTRALVLYGVRDELIPEEPTMDAIRALPRDAGHRAAIYRGGWHLLLRDLGAETVLDDVLAWTADPAAPLPSGADREAAKAAGAVP
jgi:acylglycerol lipase